MSALAVRTTRLRAGLYRVTDAEGRAWSIEEREVSADYGGGWAWFAACDDDPTLYLDPLPTLREAKAAVIG